MSKQIPDGWKQATLGEVSSIIMGQSPTSDTYNGDGHGIPFFQGKADFGSKRPKTRFWCTSPTKIAPRNSILFSVRAPVGDINICDVEACIGRGLASIIGTKVEEPFLFQLLGYSKKHFEALGQGSTFEAINGKELKDFKINLPPLPEQKKIAAILTSVDEVIESTQKQINKLQDLKKAIMNELLTKGIGHTEFKDSELGRIPKSWEVVRLSELVGSLTGGVSVNSENRVTAGSERGVLKTSCISSGEFFPSEHKAVVKEDVERVAAPVEAETILFSRMNTPSLVGESCYVKNTVPNLYLPDRLWSLKVKNAESISVRWLSWLLTSSEVKKAISDAATGTSGSMKNISRPNLLSLKVRKPPSEEQFQIAASVCSLHDVIVSNHWKLKQTQSLKKSLMQDLLTGKVRVKVN